MNKIKINKDKKYLNEVYESLPIDVILNKGVTGCGGTTVALTEARKTIIAVPFVSLIQSKLDDINKNPDLFKNPVIGAYGTLDEDLIKRHSFKENNKIICTYDALEKITRLINHYDYHIVIDEYHILTKHYDFRFEAVQSVLNNFKKYRSFTFISATPIEENFILDELKDIDTITLEWENKVNVEYLPTKCKSIESTIATIIKDHLEGQQLAENSNLHIFCNSIKFAEKMKKACSLKASDFRSVYSKNNERKYSIERSEITSEVKKINFYTSTAFEGCDIYDENGITIIVSDATQQSTLLDIATDVIQISGRIRNSKYIDQVWHFYKNSKYLDTQMSFEDFEKESLKAFDNEKTIFDHNCKLQHELLATVVKNLIFVSKKDGRFEMSKSMLNVELRNYKLLNSTYIGNAQLSDEYINNGLIATEQKQRKDALRIPLLHDGKNLKEAIDVIENTIDVKEKHIKIVELNVQFPWIREAIEVIGIGEIKRLNFKKTNIERQIKTSILKNSSEDVKIRIAKLFFDTFVKGFKITKKEAKLKLAEAYVDLNIDEVAKASFLSDIYLTKETSIRNKKTGKSDSAIEIIRLKIAI